MVLRIITIFLVTGRLLRWERLLIDDGRAAKNGTRCLGPLSALLSLEAVLKKKQNNRAEIQGVFEANATSNREVRTSTKLPKLTMMSRYHL